MPARRGEAVWEGDLRDGSGTISLGSGAFSGSYSFASRFEDAAGIAMTNPEELIGVAHAGCFSMALSAALAAAGHTARRVHTTATVRLERQEAGFAITRIDRRCEAEVPGIDKEAFRKEAETAKANCPVSKALAGTEITLEASLV
jgi:osmotically inducible protein OsmC